MNAAPILLIIIVAQIRQLFKKEKASPELQELAQKSLYIACGLIILNTIPFIGPIAKWVTHAILILLIYAVYNRDELKRFRNVMYAYIPLLMYMVLDDLITLLPTSWEENITDYMDVVQIFAFIWMVAMLIIANKQNKALRAEQVKWEEEERMKQIAEEKKAELEILVAERTREILRQKEELQQAVEDLRATQDQLVHAEKMASLGELTAGIAHEIQNPLNFVNNFSEVNIELTTELNEEIDNLNLQPQEKEQLVGMVNMIRQNQDKINYHGKRADSIVKGMLQHSRTGTGQKEPVELNSMVDEYVRLSYHGLRAKDKGFNATLDIHLDPAIDKIMAIPQDLGRALLNILNNAFYAVNEKKQTEIEGYAPTLTVHTKLVDRGKKWVYITIRDNGLGIPEAVKDKIFQPFYTTKPTGKGTGLGLSLSYDIINKGHGGELSMHSRENEYTEFIIKLPV